MSFYQQYISGETEEVYEKISSLGHEAFSASIFPDVEKVLTETFERVAFNLEIIHQELTNIDYNFRTEVQYSYDRSLHSPLPKTENLLFTLDSAVKRFGFVPHSLKYFYKIVGGVDFSWDYENGEEGMWKLADPIQVASLDNLLEEVTREYWEEEMLEYVEEGETAFLELSADEFHKDNISGGPAYSLELTYEPTIDGFLFNEHNSTTFINYLRICFDSCGFPGLHRHNNFKNHLNFLEKVKPFLKKI